MVVTDDYFQEYGTVVNRLTEAEKELAMMREAAQASIFGEKLLVGEYAELREATRRLLRVVGRRCGPFAALDDEERGAIALATALTEEKE